MSTRKIRMTLASDLHEQVGALIDIDFNNENLEFDLQLDETAGNGTTREYVFDLPAGTYDLTFTFKNDVADFPGEDRNLIIENLEVANDGVNYQPIKIEGLNPMDPLFFGTFIGTELLEDSTLAEVFDFPIRMFRGGTATVSVEFT